MRPTSELKYVRHFFGLGVGFETFKTCDDRCMWSWKVLHVKVYLGPLVWLMNFPSNKRRKAVLTPMDLVRS